MSTYVDPAKHNYGRMIVCHMWADSLDELLAMADLIGVQRKWLQQPPKASWVHFDIAKTKRALAVSHGARLDGNQWMIDQIISLRERKASKNA